MTHFAGLKCDTGVSIARVFLKAPPRIRTNAQPYPCPNADARKSDNVSVTSRTVMLHKTVHCAIVDITAQ